MTYSIQRTWRTIRYVLFKWGGHLKQSTMNEPTDMKAIKLSLIRKWFIALIYKN